MSRSAAPFAAHDNRIGLKLTVIAMHGLALWGLQQSMASHTMPHAAPTPAPKQLVMVTLPRESVALPSLVPEKPVPRKPAMPPQITPKWPASPAPTPPAINAPVTVMTTLAPATVRPADTSLPTEPRAQPTPPAESVISAMSTAASQSPDLSSMVELPSTDADYLQNPKPIYPPMSKRLREQGQVLIRVLIDESGNPRQAELRRSSGFDRLDASALQTVLLWRYVAGTRGGVPEAMWFVVPINFVIE